MYLKNAFARRAIFSFSVTFDLHLYEGIMRVLGEKKLKPCLNKLFYLLCESY